MADGTNWVLAQAADAQAPRGRDIVVATCRNRDCRAEAVIDDGSRPPSLLRSFSGERLEGCLRCVCGARSGAISTRPFWGPRPAMAGGIFLFVV